MLICKLQMELKWQVRLSHAFLLKSLPAAHKGIKCRKRGFLHVSASKFNPLTAELPETAHDGTMVILPFVTSSLF